MSHRESLSAVMHLIITGRQINRVCSGVSPRGGAAPFTAVKAINTITKKAIRLTFGHGSQLQCLEWGSSVSDKVDSL